MEIINRIKDGLHQDNNVYDQPANTMRDNLNGIITDLGNGYYKWSNLKGNTLSFTLGIVDQYMSHCLIRERLFILCLDTLSDTVRLYEVDFVNNVGTASVIYTVGNIITNLSFDWPVRTMFGFYENEETQRIYWSDYHNSPKLINVGTKGVPVVVNSKFLEFFPVINKVYGTLTSADIVSGGSLKSGTYFVAWRYYTNDGYFTDWSPLSNPIKLNPGTPGITYESYQAYEGDNPDSITNNKLSLVISDIDTDYENIQICAFYSNDMNIAAPGTIFYDGSITAVNMTIEFVGSENAGSISMDDLVETSLKIDLIKDMTPARKQNIIACVKERPDLDLPSSVNANITIGVRNIPLDTTGYLGRMVSHVDVRSLNCTFNSTYDEGANILRRGQWYKATSDLVYDIGGGGINVASGNLFYVHENAPIATCTSGTFKAIVMHKKYLKAGGVSGGDINTEYVTRHEELNGEFYNFKSQKVCRWYKSYPMGETIRLGVVFFDLTGRPFMARHLYNTNMAYGPGDTLMSKRGLGNEFLDFAAPMAGGNNGFYQEASGRLNHLIVSNLDITDVANQISGFMIVRAPIIHQYIGMGLLTSTYLDGDDVYSLPNFTTRTLPSAKYKGCYDFYCAEDVFNLKDFSIQPGDQIENITYFQPYYQNEVTTVPVHGGTFHDLGRLESNENVDFAQKFYIDYMPYDVGQTNMYPTVSHEVVNVTKYTFGDNDLPIDPLDATKLYQALSHTVNDGFGTHHGYNCTHSVLMLDIPDDLSNNKVYNAIADYPLALLCAVKRPNTSPYGGINDSSYANTLYLSTGHFQEINASVLADVLSGGRYIFNEIDVFGGDTFVQLFDLKRLYKNYDLPTDEGLGQIVIFPIESRLNIEMREGNHASKIRSFDSLYNAGGLKFEVGATVLEDFNYNDGYSSDNINDLYIPVPFRYKNLTDMTSRIRYSPEKNYGELRDSFRRFLANDYIDLDPNKGIISNIKYKSNRLIYWQPNEVGYIPLQERALTQNSIGQPVQLGIGGLFERYDQLIDKIGNSHQFGLVESPLGYHWYDSRRKIHISIGFNLQIGLDSIIKGMDKFHNENIIDDLDLYDNPFSANASYLGGCFGGYDPMTKMVFYSYIVPSGGNVTRYTIGIHTVLNKYVGRYDIYPGAYFTVKDHLFQMNLERLGAYINGTGTYSNFFGSQYGSFVTIIVKEESNTAKIFDTFEMIGNENLFSSILYENTSQSIEEIIASYFPLSVLNRNYDFKKRRWFGNFPRVSRERLSDGYLKITFKMNYPYLVELYDFKSNVRKIY